MPPFSNVKILLEQPLYDIKAHHLMIFDRMRSNAYRKAIFEKVKQSDVVLDLGCGSGILSLFAAQKGCKKIYAIDISPIIRTAEKIAQDNHITNIDFITSDIYKYSPSFPIDVLIHEQIGQYIWDEDMIKKVSFVRNHYLKPNATIIPAQLDIYAAATSRLSPFEKALSEFKENPWGLDLSSLRKQYFLNYVKIGLTPFTVELDNTKDFIVKPKKVHTIDFYSAHEIEPLEYHFMLPKGETVRGIILFFVVNLTKSILLSTIPKNQNTHWGQICVPLGKSFSASKETRCIFYLQPDVLIENWKKKLTRE